MRSRIASPGPLGLYSDAARRMSDTVNLHSMIVSNSRRWIAIRLSDGGDDGTVYDMWCDAVHAQLHPTQCLYLRLPHVATEDRMDPQQAEVLLRHHRQLYDAGLRQPHPPVPCNGRCGR